MTSQEAKFSDQSSDRQVRIAIVLSVLTATLTLVLEVFNHLGWMRKHAKGAAWAEIGSELLAAAAIAGPARWPCGSCAPDAPPA